MANLDIKPRLAGWKLHDQFILRLIGRSFNWGGIGAPLRRGREMISIKFRRRVTYNELQTNQHRSRR